MDNFTGLFPETKAKLHETGNKQMEEIKKLKMLNKLPKLVTLAEALLKSPERIQR